MRLQALLLVKNVLSPAKIAENFLEYRSSIYLWVKRAEQERNLSLKCKHGRGKVLFNRRTIFEDKDSTFRVNTNR